MAAFRLILFVLLLSVLVQIRPPLAWAQENDWREMKVKGVVMDPHGDTPVVLLEETQERHTFPIWIGLSEARAIALELEHVPTPRPFTHALLKNILATLQVEVVHVVIHDIRDNTFYATIALRANQQMLSIDARPSDAIALALSANAPIFVAAKVLGTIQTIPPHMLAPVSTSTQALGMHIQNLDAGLASFFQIANTDGVLVAFVETASEAERRGMRQGDVITRINGKVVKDIQDVLNQVQEVKKEQEIVLQITREKHVVTIRLSAVSP
jgi:bifunctional DNase/RNase